MLRLLATFFVGYAVFGWENTEDTEGCHPLLGLDKFNDDYLSTICGTTGDTDKSTSAKICPNSKDPITGKRYEKVPERKLALENALKLALVNQMYGIGPIPEGGDCNYFCMYDPQNVGTPGSMNPRVGFIWRNGSTKKCWDIVNAYTCYTGAGQEEWIWAIEKSYNWCPESNDVQAQTCDPAKNDPITELNYEGCNNAGTCIGGKRPRCVCCDKSDPNNWCALNDKAQVPYLFTGSDCTTATFKYAVQFSWWFESSASGTPELICDDSLTNPPGEGGLGTPTTPDLTPQINAALKGLGYKGLAYPIGCQTCRFGNPCYHSDAADVDKGVLVGFATELNSYYDHTCTDFQIDQPTDCPANTDLGAKAYTAFINARGDVPRDIFDPPSQLTATLNAILYGEHPGCTDRSLSGICLGFTDAWAAAYMQHDLDAQRENFILPDREIKDEEDTCNMDPAKKFKKKCNKKCCKKRKKEGCKFSKKLEKGKQCYTHKASKFKCSVDPKNDGRCDKKCCRKQRSKMKCSWSKTEEKCKGEDD